MSKTIEDLLRHKLSEFEPLQGIHYLQLLLRAERNHINKLGERPIQSIRFHSKNDHKIAPDRLEPTQTGDLFDVVSSTMTLAGTRGVLPKHYTDTLVEQGKLKQKGFAEFLEFLNQRTQQLHYEAWLKHRLAQSLENGFHSLGRSSSKQSQFFSSLTGILDLKKKALSSLELNEIASLSGLLSRSVQSLDSIRQICQFVTGLKTKVVPFQGEWQPIPKDLQLKLPAPSTGLIGRNNQLGINTVLGKRNWYVQGRFRVILEAKNFEQVLALHPKGQHARRLRQVMRLSAGLNQKFNISLETESKNLKQVKLTNRSEPSVLGWNSLIGKCTTETEKITINIL